MAELGVEEVGFLRFVRQLFAQKRKTLANNLRAAGYSPQAVASALAHAEVPAQARSEALTIETFAGLWKCLAKTEAASPSEAAPVTKNLSANK